MTKLYLDCDGVILDTINMSYKMIKNKGLTNEKDIEHFYKNLSWEELIIEAGEINNFPKTLTRQRADLLLRTDLLRHLRLYARYGYRQCC